MTISHLKSYNCPQINYYYQIEMITGNHIIIWSKSEYLITKLFVLIKVTSSDDYLLMIIIINHWKPYNYTNE